jgi:hypothetical protein
MKYGIVGETWVVGGIWRHLLIVERGCDSRGLHIVEKIR